MITIVDFGSKKTPMLTQHVYDLGARVRVVNWKMVWNQEDYELTTGIIFSGSPTFFTEVDHRPYTERYGFVRNGKIPTLGICFGHQLMGLLHDATIFRGYEVRTTIPVNVVKEDVLFKGLSPVTQMAEDHTEGISLPPSFIHLATSQLYTIEGMRHPVLPLWGVQFHPEVSGENGKILIGNFLGETNR